MYGSLAPEPQRRHRARPMLPLLDRRSCRSRVSPSFASVRFVFLGVGLMAVWRGTHRTNRAVQVSNGHYVEEDYGTFGARSRADGGTIVIGCVTSVTVLQTRGDDSANKILKCVATPKRVPFRPLERSCTLQPNPEPSQTRGGSSFFVFPV